ncbi:hypothetical protein [Legionella sp.]|uniref:hypothetical protein n=1 Tax=Legionella sp. TaxID=459 RepID=UPI003CB3F97A
MCIGQKKFKTSAQLFAHLAPSQHHVFGMRVHVFGQPLYLANSKNSLNELMIVVTNKHPKNAIACYLQRWEIGVSRLRMLHLVGESPTEEKDSSLVAREPDDGALRQHNQKGISAIHQAVTDY